MLLEAFKMIHGISEIKWKRSKKTQRLVAKNTSLPIVMSKNCDPKKELYIVETHKKDETTGLYTGELVYSVCNQNGWEDVDFTS